MEKTTFVSDGRDRAKSIAGERRVRPSRLLVIAALAGVIAACSSPEERVEKYYASGVEFLEAGQNGKANVQFQNVLKINESHVPSLVGLAQIAEKKKDLKLMFGLYQRIVRLEPDNVFAQIQLGKLYLLASDETAALEHVDKALAIEPNNRSARALKAGVLLRLGDSANAVALAREVVNEEPANAEAAVVLATSKVKDGDVEGGLAELDAALDADPKIAVLQILRIRLLEQLGRKEDALQNYAELIKLFPEEAAYRRAYAGEFIKRQDLTAAQQQLEAIVELEPNNDDAKYDVVRLVNAEEGPQAAEKKLRSYIDANSDNADLKFGLADFLNEQKASDQAIAALEPLTKSKEKSVALKAKNRIAGYHLANGELERAKTLTDEILAEDEGNIEGLIKRAGFQINDKNYDAAVANLRTALNNQPDSVQAMLLMATAFEQQDDVDVARAEYAKAFDASGKDAKVANSFGKFLARTGNSRRAEEVLVQSLAAHPGNLENLRFLAAIRLQQQDWRGAAEVAEIIDTISVSNDDNLARNIRTAAFSGLGEFDQLIDLLASDGQAAPLDSRPLATLVAAYIRTERTEEAEKMLEDVLASKPDDYAANILLAQVKSVQGKNDEIEAPLLKAIESDPKRAAAYEFLYRYYLGSDQAEKADTLIAEALRESPDDDALKYYQADILLRGGDREKALAIYSDLIEKRPNDTIVANNFVSLSSDLRTDEASIARALEAAKVLEEQDNPSVQDTVGWAYYRAGQYDRAVEFLTKASAATGDNAEILYHLGAAQFAAGDVATARENLNKALQAGGADFRFTSEINTLLARE